MSEVYFHPLTTDLQSSKRDRVFIVKSPLEAADCQEGRLLFCTRRGLVEWLVMPLDCKELQLCIS